jgi:hypothetical protein
MPNALGQHSSVPNNKYVIRTRKGATPSANDTDRVASIVTEISVPAGTELYDHPEIQAMLSLHCGVLWAEADGIGDTTESGIV